MGKLEKIFKKIKEQNIKSRFRNILLYAITNKGF